MEECRDRNADDTKLSIISADGWSVCMVPFFPQKPILEKGPSRIPQGAVFGLEEDFSYFVVDRSGTEPKERRRNSLYFWLVFRTDVVQPIWHRSILIYIYSY